MVQLLLTLRSHGRHSLLLPLPLLSLSHRLPLAAVVGKGGVPNSVGGGARPAVFAACILQRSRWHG